MRIKPHIVAVASTATLRKMVDDFELEVTDKRKREVLEGAISGARRCKPEELLAYLSEQEVKQVCEAAGVDSKGRRTALVERLVGGVAPMPVTKATIAPKPVSTRATTVTTHFPKRLSMNDKQQVQGSLQIDSPDAGVANVEKYEFEPIKGYPMLNWRGKRPFNSTQYYPAQLKEVHGEEVDGWRNKIYWGDNLQVMSHLLKQFRGKVDLIYIDPPFDSKAEYKKTISLKSGSASSDSSPFEEKQYSDIWNNDEYLQFIYERMILARELLADGGSLYFHCDSHRVHYIKCLLDEIFGIENFQNDVIWKRTGSHNSAKRYGPIHDTLLFYTKGSEFHWTGITTPYDDEYQKRFSYADQDGRKFQPISLIAAGLRSGSTGKPWRGIDVSKNGNHWRTTIEKLDKLDEDGYIFWPQGGGLPRLKQYLDESKGNPIQDIWVDIPAINSQAQEREDYPTQKPEALLKRVIEASTSPGALVFDFFMGSGTTQVAAMKLGRRFIGADINLGAIQTSTRRFINAADDLRQKKLDQEEKHYTGFELHNVNHYDIFRNPVQAKELLIEALEIQKLEFSTVFDGEKDGRMVKIMPVNRIATRADLNELIAGFDYKSWERKQNESPNRPVEKITLVCIDLPPVVVPVIRQEVRLQG